MTFFFGLLLLLHELYVLDNEAGALHRLFTERPCLSCLVESVKKTVEDLGPHDVKILDHLLKFSLSLYNFFFSLGTDGRCLLGSTAC